MPLEVIGAGFGRTGTHSLKLALEELGFGKCYHMEHLIADHPQDVHYWEDAYEGKPVNWENVYHGYRSAVDFPTCHFYEQFLKVYPNAKFILTTRDPEKWYKSFYETIYQQSKPTIGKKLAMGIRLPFNKKLRQQLQVFKFAGKNMNIYFNGNFEDKDSTIQFFINRNEKVRQTIPKD